MTARKIFEIKLPDGKEAHLYGKDIGDPEIHIDGAWVTCCQDITFNFNHPAIKSFAISLSKGLALGWNRIGIRYSRTHQTDSIGLMNDFNMNCRSLTWPKLCRSY